MVAMLHSLYALLHPLAIGERTTGRADSMKEEGGTKDSEVPESTKGRGVNDGGRPRKALLGGKGYICFAASSCSV